MKKPTQYERERMLYKNKPRKILNLEERVQAIRLYDRNPVYQRVATVFHCSWEQIKNIVSNRDSILSYYARCQIIDANDGPRQVRHKKINFLSSVMYEYIKRVHYYKKATITDELIRAKALEFRELIEIEKFHPNRAWIKDFKQLYNIDLEKPENLLVPQRPPESLECVDIIAHCTNEVENVRKIESVERASESAVEAKLKQGSLDEYYEPVDMEANTEDALDDDDDEDNEDGCENGYGKRHKNDVEFDVSDYLHFASGFLDEQPAYDDTVSPEIDTTPDNVHNEVEVEVEAEAELAEAEEAEEEQNNNMESKCTQSSAKSYGTITNYNDALIMLRSLEDFAVEREDFRAINLLSQLAEYYEKITKNKKKKLKQK